MEGIEIVPPVAHGLEGVVIVMQLSGSRSSILTESTLMGAQQLSRRGAAATDRDIMGLTLCSVPIIH